MNRKKLPFFVNLDFIHYIMSDPEGNSFVFPRDLMFSEMKSRETSGLERKQN